MCVNFLFVFPFAGEVGLAVRPGIFLMERFTLASFLYLILFGS